MVVNCIFFFFDASRMQHVHYNFQLIFQLVKNMRWKWTEYRELIFNEVQWANFNSTVFINEFIGNYCKVYFKEKGKKYKLIWEWLIANLNSSMQFLARYQIVYQIFSVTMHRCNIFNKKLFFLWKPQKCSALKITAFIIEFASDYKQCVKWSSIFVTRRAILIAVFGWQQGCRYIVILVCAFHSRRPLYSNRIEFESSSYHCLHFRFSSIQHDFLRFASELCTFFIVHIIHIMDVVSSNRWSIRICIYGI